MGGRGEGARKWGREGEGGGGGWNDREKGGGAGGDGMSDFERGREGGEGEYCDEWGKGKECCWAWGRRGGALGSEEEAEVPGGGANGAERRRRRGFVEHRGVYGLVLLFLLCGTSRGLIGSDNCTCCHTDIEAAEHP